jgi:hypothetical protein
MTTLVILLLLYPVAGKTLVMVGAAVEATRVYETVLVASSVTVTVWV